MQVPDTKGDVQNFFLPSRLTPAGEERRLDARLIIRRLPDTRPPGNVPGGNRVSRASASNPPRLVANTRLRSVSMSDRTEPAHTPQEQPVPTTGAPVNPPD